MSDIDTIKNLHQRIARGQFTRFQTVQHELMSLYARLDPAGGQQMGRHALQLHDEGDRNQAEDILLHVACMVPGGLAGLHEDFLRRGIFRRAEIYLGADDEAVASLLRLVEVNAEHRDHLLMDLAWADGKRVEQAFRNWKSTPPPWADTLNNPPAQYSHEAGWELDHEGHRRELFHRTCYRLVAREADKSLAPSPVTVLMPRADTCPWCEQPLSTLFSLDLSAPELRFLDLPWPALRLATCDRCGVYANIYMKVNESGETEWHPANALPEWLDLKAVRRKWAGWPSDRLVLGPPRRSPFETHDLLTDEGSSQIGGHPAWVESSAYPICPECSHTMLFIGQVAYADIDVAEGLSYAFVCASCHVAATVYQQS